MSMVVGDVDSDCVRPRCPIVCLCGGREPHEYAAGDGAGRWGRTVKYKGKQGVCACVTAAVPRARAQSPLPPALLYSRSIRALPRPAL